LSYTLRPALGSEYPQVRAILARAFATDDEARLWDYLAAHDPALVPAGVRVAETDEGQLVACTVVLPRRVRMPQGWVDGAAITLVACEPEHQGKGYGGATVRDALAYMAAQGLAVGLLYGHPEYYPRLGFVPVLPAQLTMLAVGAIPRGERVEQAAPADLDAVTALYVQRVAVYPGAMARTAAPWQWQARSGGHALLTLPDRQGYAFTSRLPEQELLYVHEAAATDDDAARRLLSALGAEASNHGLANLKLNLPPDHALVQKALACGAEQAYRPAGPGMAAVTRWESLLPSGYAVTDEGLAYDGRLVLQASRAALTQLVMGYRSAGTLLAADACSLEGGDVVLAQVDRDFPSTFPKWSLEPFWS
jgi:predicted N-acetyltransferase YhbS